MDKAVSDFQQSLASARTGRASVHMLDSIRVDYYGSPMPLNQLAQVNAPEAQLITVRQVTRGNTQTSSKPSESLALGKTTTGPP